MRLEPPTEQIQPGQCIAQGRYLLLEVLGRGGLATVFAARDTRDGSEVAVKVLCDRYVGRPEREPAEEGRDHGRDRVDLHAREQRDLARPHHLVDERGRAGEECEQERVHGRRRVPERRSAPGLSATSE